MLPEVYGGVVESLMALRALITLIDSRPAARLFGDVARGVWAVWLNR
jgi:hypothetical protein